jgi:glycosyltransferase involved in cell wall biosynthesis
MLMGAAVTVDVAGGPMGGAARFRLELYKYLKGTGRKDIGIIGANRRLDPAWLMRREMVGRRRARRVALNNVGFVAPGGERWTLLGNALHFLTGQEISALDPSLWPVATRQAAVVRLAARRSDVLIAPCSAMAERVAHVMPAVSKRLVVRMHPVSCRARNRIASSQTILCPIIFEPYKHMPTRLTEWLSATEGHIDPSIMMLVTARPSDVPASLAGNPRVKLVGRVDLASLQQLWESSRAIYFPPDLESFGFPLAEARAYGLPVIAQDTSQNREIAGNSLCGFSVSDPDSLLYATENALRRDVMPDPSPFNPTAYFEWMLGLQS